jgi:hypothetical protein
MAAKKDQDDAEEDEAQVALLIVAPCRAETLNFCRLHQVVDNPGVKSFKNLIGQHYQVMIGNFCADSSST